MKTYRVSGPFAFRDTQPGGSFEGDPKSPQIQRAIGRGSITEEKAPAPAPKTSSGDEAGEKEAK